MSAEGGTKAVVAALTANLAIALVKFGAWALTGASSMLAEAIHSVADSGNQVLLLVGGKRAKKGVTPEHPFGYGRERYIFGFIVAVVLFSVGGLFALYEAYHKWHEIHLGHEDALLDGRWWWVPLVVLGAAIVAEGLSFRTAVRESNKTRGKQTWPKFIRSAKAPELPVILLEDFAALIGLVFAFLGIGLTLLTRNAAVRRRRHRADRAAAGGGGRHARDRDQEPAARRVRRAGRRPAHRAGAVRHRRRGAGHPHEDDAPGPRGDPRRREDRGQPGGPGDRGRRRSSTGPRWRSARPSRW